jgi:Transposase DDE domain group 1
VPRSSSCNARLLGQHEGLCSVRLPHGAGGAPPPRPHRRPHPSPAKTPAYATFHGLAHNRIQIAIAALAADLLAWTARLALPAPTATYEPKRLRLRILAVAARLVHTARRRLLTIDPAWPWADTITTASTRLIALPAH